MNPESNSGLSPAQKSKLALYVHIPFCRYRCPYCDFYIQVSQNKVHHLNYFELIKQEIGSAQRFFSPDAFEISSIYFGGGTPSLVDPAHINSVMAQLASNFSMGSEVETTLECNPEDIQSVRLKQWRKAGINRISYGMQADSPQALAELGRQHAACDPRRQLSQAIDAGIENLSVDLIFGGPKHSLEAWEKTLAYVSDLPIQHISAYALTLETGTVFERNQSSLKLPSDDQSQVMFAQTQRTLSSAGFVQYEISNYAKPGFVSKHNLSYWSDESYWGLGVGAHSFDAAKSLRWQNPKNTFLYAQSLDAGRRSEKHLEVLRSQDIVFDYLHCGLRLTEGLHFQKLQAKLHKHLDLGREKKLTECFEKLLTAGLLKKTGERLHIPKNKLVLSNLVFENIFEALKF